MKGPDIIRWSSNGHFSLVKTLDAKQQMIGNGVPVNMAQAIVRQVKLAFGAIKSNVVAMQKPYQMALNF
ncbi:MAG TPA: hypothetical protein VIM51_05290 [Desulfosporosinus sp.]